MQELKNYLSVKDYLNNCFIEREELIDGIMITLLAQENALLIGPPGTGKSDIVMSMSRCFNGLKYFQWLLTEFSTPEEIFGAYNLQDLSKGIYRRNTEYKLPVSHISFLDEVFKGSSAILNSLLTILNERLFYDYGLPQKTPIMSVFGASNELPEQGDGLDAINDRFVMRFVVNPIKENNNFKKFLHSKTANNGITMAPIVSGKDLATLQNMVLQIKVDAGLVDTIQEIREELIQSDIKEPSTRRFGKCIRILQAAALLDGSNVVDFTHLKVLKNVLWQDIEEKVTVASIVAKYCVDTFTSTLQAVATRAKDVYENGKNSNTTDNTVESLRKLKEIEKELDSLKSQYPNKETKINEEIKKVKEFISLTTESFLATSM